VDRVDLTWLQGGAGYTGFELQRKTGAGAYAALALPGGTVRSYADTGLAAGTTYTYRVRAAGPGGPSDWSLESAATTPATAARGKLTVTPSRVNFGTVRAGAAPQRRIRLRNAGREIIVVCNGSPAAPFSVTGGGSSASLLLCALGLSSGSPLQRGPSF